MAQRVPFLRRLLARLGLDKTLRDFLGDTSTGQNRSDSWNLISDNRAPNDLPWATRQRNLSDAFVAWRTNPLARRIVALTTDYCIGDGVHVDSPDAGVADFIGRFWAHRKNKMLTRLPLMLDEQSRAGELFTVLHRNPMDGLSYVRHLPASCIEAVEWRAGDYEQLTRVWERVPGQMELRGWNVYQPDEPEATADQSVVVLHQPINRPVGATRGEGDLDAILYWLQQYSDWLDGRVKVNKAKSDFYYDISVDDTGNPNALNDAKKSYRDTPASGKPVVHSAKETHKVNQPRIDAGEASGDGQAVRLMVATGAHIPLHFLSEVMSGSALASTADMNEPTFRHYEGRQVNTRAWLIDLIQVAYRRAAEVGAVPVLDEIPVIVEMPEVQRDDNGKLATAARDVAQAFATVKLNGLVADRRVLKLIYKFAGELLTEDDLDQIIAEQSNGRKN